MDTSSTVFKALDILTILASRDEGLSLPDLALALNQPRSNVVRLVRTLQSYGFVSGHGRQWIATSTFRDLCAPSGRHSELCRRYRSVLGALSSATGELVILGLHEGNGIIHIDAIESDRLICLAPAPTTRHSLRFNALGKLALSRRPDLAARFPDPAFQRELDEVRCTGVAWNREETVRGMIAMAIPGFSNCPTEPMLEIAWPKARFTQQAADHARRVAQDAMSVAEFEDALPAVAPAWSA